MSLRFLIFIILLFKEITFAAESCTFVAGRVLCRHNQTRVIGTNVELWDEDSVGFLKFFDPDDRVTIFTIQNEDGLFDISGCASDQNWFYNLPNRPEFFLKVMHKCNSDKPELLVIKPSFQIFVPEMYDYHIEHPIILD
ncbi:Transthyretin-like family-containing protein [Strongyloides ratti]|uniref:Transthyretin-like family-containing protein n=1 Tax=Strongyloides ratti TaxID=34506 RepID=A0A090LSS9_STRRB|nr:Transthyretin-like family-containing protein [Strongyloides ratti]CEF71242.1 Transthyretin-like family-containing protein [Strongyloides ratti]